MTTRRGFRLFEFLLVTVIFGIIVLFAVNRFEELGRETRRLGFELLAHNFTTAVAGVRTRWLIQGQPEVVVLEGWDLRMSPEGWPLATTSATEQGLEQGAACLSLWQTLFQNPQPATVEGSQLRGERRYHIRGLNNEFCRYELVTKERESHYFDYTAKTGQVLIHVPLQKKIPDL